jgi:hypothetical protein
MLIPKVQATIGSKSALEIAPEKKSGAESIRHKFKAGSL